MELRPLKSDALILAAAAVSDFYLPPEDTVRARQHCCWAQWRAAVTQSAQAEHKIQSRSGDLKLHMKQVPKMLGCIVDVWSPEACLVSFKVFEVASCVSVFA